jgi:NitT/TauT family transport system permease protein
MKSRIQAPLIFGLLTLAGWQVIVMAAKIPEYLLPAPTAIFANIDRTLAVQLGVTFAEALAGFLIASVLAFGCAIMFVRFGTLEGGALSDRHRDQNHTDRRGRAVAGDLAGDGVVVQDRRGDPHLLLPRVGERGQGAQGRGCRIPRVVSDVGATRSQEFRKLRIPYCLPYLFSALKISSSLAIVGAIVGEFVGATQGLGYLIMVSSAHLETATLFAAIAAAAVAGIAMFYVIGWTEERVIFWHGGNME